MPLEFTFRSSNITNTELTTWILNLAKKRKVKITDLRYFGSRVFGNPRSNSDFDVYITTIKGKKHLGGGPIFTELYKGHQIEFHAFEDFSDGFVNTYLIGSQAQNEICSSL